MARRTVTPDRIREQIFTRYSERQRRLQFQVDARSQNLANRDWLSVNEVLAWIIDAGAADDLAIASATKRPCSQIANSAIVSWGRRGSSGTRELISALHEPIPPSLFVNVNNTLCLDGWATCIDDAPASEWGLGPEWGDVRFKPQDVLRLWPPRKASKSSPSTAATDRKWKDWLATEMRAAPVATQSKAMMREHGNAVGLPVISNRAFARAWADAATDAQAEAWTIAGRRKKAPRT